MLVGTTRWPVALAAVVLMAGLALGWSVMAGRRANPAAAAPGDSAAGRAISPAGPPARRFADPNRPGAEVFIDPRVFEADLFQTAADFTTPLPDDATLAQIRDAVAGRGDRARESLTRQLESLTIGDPPTTDQARAAVPVLRKLGYIAMYDGRLDEAARWLRQARALAQRGRLGDDDELELVALLGIVALRKAEQENCIGCIGPSSCIFPLADSAVHKLPEGSREAMAHFREYLDRRPGDLRVRWLLNIAAMTLGQYPAGVPAELRIPLDSFRSTADIGRFDNVAGSVGLYGAGTAMAGGVVFDDLNGDGLEDLFVSTIDADRGPTVHLNNGDGTFADHTKAAGLGDQVYALNVTSADYDNDGDLDLLLLRGGWEKPARLSLLRNRGDATFDDVTLEAGMGEPIACESAAWADYDLDGDLDVYTCGEYDPSSLDARNLCRLYRNDGDGTFTDVAADAGVANDRFAKGCAWGDYDNDGRPDLFVSNMSIGSPMASRLYHNNGDGTFTDAAPALGLDAPSHLFTCVWWDYDNDGWLDLLVSDYVDSLAEVLAQRLGLPVEGLRHPRLYRNRQGQGFTDVSAQVGLGNAMPAMSLNVGDLDNDGWLDLHLGTGWMSYSGLIPNTTLRNAGGTRFDDATTSSGTGHLQKGHGVSMADWDRDGDLDLFVELGGGYPGDRGHNALFRNPGHGRSWVNLRLVGTRSNRDARGARIEVAWTGKDGRPRVAHRTVGSNGSFGGNPRAQHVGLDDATTLDRITVRWPSGATQEFRDVPTNLRLTLTEDRDELTPDPRGPLPQVAAGDHPAAPPVPSESTGSPIDAR
jgi:hypothetical protein